MNEDILDIFEISGQVRQENLVQVMNQSSFFGRYSNKRIDFLNTDTFEPNYEDQIRVLISSLEDEDAMKALHCYWTDLQKSEDYDEESFLNSLMENKIQIL